MWNERQRTQKIGFELERVKRELREQHLEMGELMRMCGVTTADLDELEREIANEPPATPVPAHVLSNKWLIRG